VFDIDLPKQRSNVSLEGNRHFSPLRSKFSFGSGFPITTS
jgi:hypothetical protein